MHFGRQRDDRLALNMETRFASAPRICRLTPEGARHFAAMLDLFGTVFEDAATYGARRPGPAYVTQLLANPAFVALVALEEGCVVGALAAYELAKFEQERSEFYIYDLAVAETHRRRGIATALIADLCAIARERGAWVVMVQADQGDEAAIGLYTKLGVREEVLHFDIPVEGGRPGSRHPKWKDARFAAPSRGQRNETDHEPG
jgi:aminoglycoside 3-N-acetyltransferase I